MTSACHTWGVPKLWSETIEAHRASVRDATLDTAAALVAAHGLASVTMSQIAKETGIGRATLYKYFPDVEAIMTAWHSRQIDAHLGLLAAARERGGTPGQRLAAVLHTYAGISRGHGDDRLSGAHGADLVRLLHRGEHVALAERHLRDFLAELISAAAACGEVRADIAATELASYCLHALTAASDLPSKAAVTRLVGMTLDALRPGLAPTTAPPAAADSHRPHEPTGHGAGLGN